MERKGHAIFATCGTVATERQHHPSWWWQVSIFDGLTEVGRRTDKCDNGLEAADACERWIDHAIDAITEGPRGMERFQRRADEAAREPTDGLPFVPNDGR